MNRYLFDFKGREFLIYARTEAEAFDKFIVAEEIDFGFGAIPIYVPRGILVGHYNDETNLVVSDLHVSMSDGRAAPGA